MDRPSVRYGLAVFLVIAVLIVPGFGCRTGLFSLMYLIKGMDVDPDYAGLKGKKVAVVCRPVASLQYRNANAGRDIAEQVTQLLEAKVPKVHVIDQRKVNRWADENTWEDYREVGKALKADMVVGIDLESFSIYKGQTLYQGKANATIHVYDCKNGGKLVFEKIVPQSLYPPNAAVPTSDRTEPEFRQEFIAVLSDQIARHFYAHDPHADFAQDATAFR